MSGNLRIFPKKQRGIVAAQHDSQVTQLVFVHLSQLSLFFHFSPRSSVLLFDSHHQELPLQDPGPKMWLLAKIMWWKPPDFTK